MHPKSAGMLPSDGTAFSRSSHECTLTNACVMSRLCGDGRLIVFDCRAWRLSKRDEGMRTGEAGRCGACAECLTARDAASGCRFRSESLPLASPVFGCRACGWRAGTRARRAAARAGLSDVDAVFSGGDRRPEGLRISRRCRAHRFCGRLRAPRPSLRKSASRAVRPLRRS